MSGKCINMVKATGDGKPFHITHFKHTLNSFISAFYGRQTMENYYPFTEKLWLFHFSSNDSQLL